MSDLVARPSAKNTMGSAAQVVSAGEYWRWAGPEDQCPSFELKAMALPPELPLTLLVKDVRIHDGDLHSIHLGAHPSWEVSGYGSNFPLKILADDFFCNWVFVEKADAEAMREREIGAVMGKIGETTSLIARGPEKDETLLIAAEIESDEKRKAYEVWRQGRVNEIAKRHGYGEEAARRAEIEALPKEIPQEQSSSGNLPAALLPSGDIVAVQKQIEGQVLLMKAQQKWISARTVEMQAGFSVVSAFQMEKVAAVTSGISTHIARATTLLKNVHTMKLFLGEGAELARLVKGQGAPAGEPLHLMQRMLYLDEEIYIGQRFYEGFNGDNLKDLGDILAKNPAILNRMMPHPRSVVIARMRRGSRPFEFDRSGDIGSIMMQIFEKNRQDQVDSRIIILIRDGENVSMALADADISKATRLFPSKAEIDAIYRDRNGEITPHDVEYSDARHAHDDRALHYKRFLLILWGLHEREGVFGDFLSKGENWFLESIANAAFRFIHDEENVLPTDMMPVMAWLEGNNANIRSGSRVLIDTRKAFTIDSAPTAYRKHYANNPEATRWPCAHYVVATVKRRGDELIVDIPTQRESWRKPSPKPSNTPMIILSKNGYEPDGIFCLDAARPATVMRYIESRIERTNYLEWLALFDQAMPLLKARDEDQAALIGRIDEKNEIERAALNFVLHNRRARSAPGAAECKAATAIAEAWKAALNMSDSPVLVGDLGGKVYALDHWPAEMGIRVRAMALTDIETGEMTRIPATIPAQEHHLLRGSRAYLKLSRAATESAQEGFTTQDSLEILLKMDNSVGLGLIKEPKVWTEAEAEEVITGMIEADAIDGMVALPYVDHVLAVGMVPERVSGKKGWETRHNSITRSLILRESLLARLIEAGFEDQVRKGLAQVMKSYVVDRAISNIKEWTSRLLVVETSIPSVVGKSGQVQYRLNQGHSSRLVKEATGIEKLLFGYTVFSISDDDRAHARENGQIFACGQDEEVLRLINEVL